MLYLSDHKTRMIQIPYDNTEIQDKFLKSCLGNEFEKTKPDFKNDIAKIMVVENLGFIVVKVTDKYFDLLGGIKSKYSKDAIKKTTPIILDFCKNNSLIFRVQSEVEKVKKLYLEFDGFKSFEKNGMNLIYKRI